MLIALVRKELRALRRDWHGLAALFVMPAAFILIMSLALQDVMRPDASSALRWAVADADDTPRSRELVALMPGAAQRQMTPAQARAALAARRIDAFVLVEAGYAESGYTQPAILTVHADVAAPASLLEQLRGDWERAVAGAVLARMTTALPALAAIASPSQMQALTQVQRVRSAYDSPRSLTSVQQSVPAWLVFAMFFVVLPLSNIVVTERRLGTLDRLRSLGVTPPLVLASKLAPFFAIHLLQFAAMLAVGRWLVPLLGGDALALDVSWSALLLMASATSVAALGMALLIAALARTTDQATLAGAFVNIIFGALGGVMVPRQVMPAAVQPWTDLSPMAWGLQGLLDVFARGAGPGAVLPAALALVAFGAVTLTLAAWRLWR